MTSTKIPALLTPKFVTGGKPTDITFASPKPGVPDDAATPALLKAKPQLIPSVLKSPRKLALIESPYGTEDPEMREKYALYSRKCTEDSLKRMEAPFTAQMFYASILNDRLRSDKDLILIAHMSWITAADLVVVYTDFGLTDAMQMAINVALIKHKTIEYRSIGKAS
jgi:hypothetical protein